MRAAVLLVFGTTLAALFGATAGADMVVQRWGTAGFVQHKGVRFEQAGQATLMHFDLAPLPKDAQVYRARLMFLAGQGYEVSYQAGGTASALRLVGPYYQWFDAAAAVRQAVQHGQRQLALTVTGPARFSPADVVLEIAYEGALQQRVPQVTNLKATYRAGQVFLTWKEIWDIAGGKADIRWGEMVDKVKDCTPLGMTPLEKDQEIRYHIYRHTEPINARNIGRATFLYAVKPGSCYTDEAVPWAIEGEHGPKYLQKGNVLKRAALELNKPLPPGTGFYWYTCQREEKGYYAVTTCLNGVEHTVDITAANTVGPVEEKVQPPEPILYREEITPLERPAGAVHHEQWYTWWVPPPWSPYPKRYDVVVSFCPQTMLKPAPLVITRGHAWITVPEPPQKAAHEAIYLSHCSDNPNAFWMGLNDSWYTLKSREQGQWRPFPQMRTDLLVAWLKRNFAIDENRIIGSIGAWGMMEIERADLYAYLHGWGQPEVSKGFQCFQRATSVWGPPSIYANRPKEENPWYRQDYGRWVREDPARETPFFIIHMGWGAHFTEMGWPPFPRFLRGMIEAKRPFVFRSRIQNKLPVIRRDQSVPAFGNCSLDDNPGNGDLNNGLNFDAQLNGYLNWDASSVVDRPDRWEMTVWLDSSAPLPQCTVDLTPRRCQQFRPSAGKRFVWTNISLDDGRTVGKGEVHADRYGLVTLEQIMVTIGKNRIVISAM